MPIRRTIVIATSEATRAPAIRFRSRLAVLPSALIISAGLALDNRTAGTIPVIRAVIELTRSVKPRTVASMVTPRARGMAGGVKGSSNPIPQNVRRMPTPPDSNAISADSSKNCRAMRKRPAPSATRIATSFRRAMPRAISRFATFPQAISNTRPVHTESSSKARRVLPRTWSRSGTTATPQPRLDAG